MKSVQTRSFFWCVFGRFSHSMKVRKSQWFDNIYSFKVNNRNSRIRCEICSKLTMKTPEQRHWHFFLVFLLLTLNRKMLAGLSLFRHCQNNVIRTTETLNNNDVINDDLAAPTRKKNFPINTTPFKLDSVETEFNKRKISSPIIRELNALVSNKAVEAFSSKLSGVINLLNKSLPAV